MISLEKPRRSHNVEKLTIGYDTTVMAYLGYYCEREVHHGFSLYDIGHKSFTLDCPRFRDGSPRDPWTISALPLSWDWLLRKAEQSSHLGELPPALIEKIETYLAEVQDNFCSI